MNVCDPNHLLTGMILQVVGKGLQPINIASYFEPLVTSRVAQVDPITTYTPKN